MLVARLMVGQGQPPSKGPRGIPQRFINNTYEEFDKILEPQLEWLYKNNLPYRVLITDPGGYHPGVKPFDGIVQAKEEGLGDYIFRLTEYISDLLENDTEVDVYLGDPQELFDRTDPKKRLKRFKESVEPFKNCNLHVDRGARVSNTNILTALSFRLEKLYLEGQFYRSNIDEMREFGFNSIQSNMNYNPDVFAPLQEGDFVYIYREEDIPATVRKYLELGCYCSLNLKHLSDLKYTDLI